MRAAWSVMPQGGKCGTAQLHKGVQRKALDVGIEAKYDRCHVSRFGKNSKMDSLRTEYDKFNRRYFDVIPFYPWRTDPKPGKLLIQRKKKLERKSSDTYRFEHLPHFPSPKTNISRFDEFSEPASATIAGEK